REVKTAIGPVSDEQAATTGLNGLSTGQSSRQTQSPTETVEPAELSQNQRIKTQSTIKNIKKHESDTGITTLESRMLTTDGYRQDVLDAIPHMSTQELWHLVHALGGSDFKVADELDSIWEDIVEAMTPEQLVEMSATQATAETMEACNGTNKTSIGIKIPGLNDIISKFTPQSPRNLLNDCCELSRVAADRYQTIRDYAGAELEEYGLDAHVGSPGSLLIALEELKLHKESLAKVSSPENESAELNATKISSPSDSAQNHGFIDAVTTNDMTPDLIVTGEKINTAAELDDEIDRLEDLLNSVGEDAQMANLDLQNALQKQQQLLQMMSNISKTLHETSMSIIRKIGS
ncbi:MAG: hypothetical protein HOK28_23025, partial [Deltaproteobacteria bacterium]|nr:hypothetical protein [Deltaproteobacteria bacterium]